jgi:acetamidase/formamidase
MTTTHEFPTDRVHFTWDVGNEPVLTIESGDTVVYETRDVTDNQITPDSTAEAIAELDWSRVYPLAGPVRLEGAEPGDTLAIEILAVETRGWGYTLIIPGFGLLPDDFPDPYIRVFDLSNGEFAYLRDDIAIPIEPFFGTMGVCPAKEQAVMPPGRFGGNMDTRELVRGTTLCRRIPAPQYLTAGPLTPRVDRGGWYGTTGVGPDLYAAAQDAVRAMIDYLGEEQRLSREDAYVPSSLCVDLRISEVVDAGQYVVSALLPLAVFTSNSS